MNTFLKTISVAALIMFGYVQGFSQFDTTRMYKVMAKARRGEPINIVTLGGSITQGTGATIIGNRWVNIMTAWWQTKFPKSTITLYNEGIGGTGSNIGVHRVQRDVFNNKPDFVTVEYSVNDDAVPFSTQTMEGLIRQILRNDSTPGVMMLLLKQQSGATSKEQHKPVGIKYGVPMVSFADSIAALLVKDTLTIGQLYLSDGVHPNDLGHHYIAQNMIAELEKIYATLPAADSLIQKPDTMLPKPIVSTVFDHTYMYTPLDLAATQYNGWTVGGPSFASQTTSQSWTSSTIGSEITFTVDGNAISIIFSEHDAENRGEVQAWVDNGAPKTIDSYWTQTWGPATEYYLIDSGLTNGLHTLHVKILSQTSSMGNFFEILNVLKAGNISVIAPIAKTKAVLPIIINGDTIALDGSASYDPQGKSLTAFKWSVISAPMGSTAVIPNATDTITSFIPDINGTYKLGLKVCNGTDTSTFARLKFDVRTTNAVPVPVVPFQDSTIAVKSTMKLNGYNSYDSDGDLIIYTWKMKSQPSLSTAKLSNFNQDTTSFVPDRAGKYVILLTVSDAISISPAATITITAVNNKIPIAVLAKTDTVSAKQTATLDGSASYDPDGSPLTYSWSIIKKPKGSTVTVTKATADTLAFTPDVVGIYKIRFTVSDPYSISLADTIAITATIPVAVLAKTQTAVTNKAVTLDGSGSYNPANNTLTYAWSIAAKPDSSTAAITGATADTLAFTPDVAGTYAIRFTASDLYSTSIADTIVVTATAATGVNIVGADNTLSVSPNPTTGKVTIAYNVDQAGNVAISLFSVQGTKVMQLVNEKQSAGLHALTTTIAHQQGLYILVVATDTKTFVRKVIVE